eukprot:TRINITY_DN3953_c0_g1_i1.p1 TRINITY_DN3953_c0_g1~~TRINITY_DN3953_c0_g1_i1.p1  ORF type:complete len:464 (-),score=188.12 TRINITY_DN3953_c0_g1_i1:111-1502(-)
MPSSFYVLNKASEKEEVIVGVMQKIVDRLFCYCVTQGNVPIIRAQKGHAAQQIATMLDDKLRKHLNQTNNLFASSKNDEDSLSKNKNKSKLSLSDDSNDSSGSSSSSSNTSSRPVLILLDRSVDLMAMLHHNWGYQALIHDLLNMELNSLQVTVKEKDRSDDDGSSSSSSSSSGTKDKKYNYFLSDSDEFWVNNAGRPFPEVAEEVQVKVEEWRSEYDRVTKFEGGSGASGALVDAVNKLPQLNQLKMSVDMHTNIATALFNSIKERQLDVYYSVEQSLMNRTSMDKDMFYQLLSGDESAGTLDDKVRLYLIYYLSQTNSSNMPSSGLGSKQDLIDVEKQLRRNGANLSSLDTIKKLSAFSMHTDMFSSSSLTSQSSHASSSAGGFSNMLSKLADDAYSKGINTLMTGIRDFTVDPTETLLPVTSIVNSIMENKGDDEQTRDFLYCTIHTIVAAATWQLTHGF